MRIKLYFSSAMCREDDPKDITDEQSDDDPLEDDYYWSEDEGCWKPNLPKDGTVYWLLRLNSIFPLSIKFSQNSWYFRVEE